MEEMADQGTEEVLKEEPEQAPSWKQDSSLGWTVDFELSAQYLWKWHTTGKPGSRKEEPWGLSIT